MTLLFILAVVGLIYILIQYVKLKKKYKILKKNADQVDQILTEADERRAENQQLAEKNSKLEAQIETSRKKLQKMKELYESIAYAIENKNCLSPDQSAFYDALCPSVTLNLHAMDSKELNAEYKANSKLIDETVTETTTQFDEQFSNKAISAIYKLTVIAMQAELQNILYTIKYQKLADAVSSVSAMTRKYSVLAEEACQTITGTMSSYLSRAKKGKTIPDALRENIMRLKYLFNNAVKIEYNYYVKKEQEKAEQAALREQMRVEAAEKKALEEERKKVEREEAKYQAEITKLTDTISAASNEEKVKLEARIAELQNQLAAVSEKKEEIIHLQNGKAGTVYVISNLGSFGEDVFKIGMTRRAEPQDRVDELGDASVPFRFDVHSFIFSEDAVALENKLHTILNQRRVNKVNPRKEFFRISIDELQKLVYEIEPTASFNTTMAAEEFRQSMSTDEVYTSDYIMDDTE